MANRSETLAHDMLEAGNARFQAAMHPQRVLFWIVDAVGGCEVVSTNWRETTGQACEEAVGGGWLEVVHADDRALVVDGLRAAIDAREGLLMHYRIRRADGSARRVMHVAAPRTLGSGHFGGLIGTLTDESDTEAGDRILRDSKEQVFAFLEGVGLAAVAIDMQGRVAHINRVLAEQIGTPAEDLMGGDWIQGHVHAEDRARLAGFLDGHDALSAMPRELEYQVAAAQGIRLYRWYVTLIRDPAGMPTSIVMMGSDITQWRRLGDQLRLNAEIFDRSSEAMLITDGDNNIVTVNPAFTRLTGYSAAEAIGRNPRILSSWRHDKAFYSAMWKSIHELGYWRGDIWDRRKDGSVYPKFLSITAVRDEAGGIRKFSAVFYDITERKAIEAQLENIAHYDMLTGLPNRMLLHDRLEQAIAAAERLDQRFALLFIDLDGFKPVNDSHGHAVGDEVLKEVGRRLGMLIRGMDTAARLGGDEFVVILTDIRSKENARSVAEKIIENLARPYEVEGRELLLSASIGASLYPSDETASRELLRTADEAMYRAKREGKSRLAFYGGIS